MTTLMDPAELNQQLAQILMSLDRCYHGHHETERCLDCPGGLSEGNPHLKTGQKLGYHQGGGGLYVPVAEALNDSAAWRTPPVDVTELEDGALREVYRERNLMVASHTHRWPSVITPAPDYPGMHIVYILSPAGQLSWHIPREDMEHFAHVRRVSEWKWDGHSTKEKYRRLDLACRMCEGKT